MTNLPFVIDFVITDGRIDQMGSGMSDIEKLIETTTNTPQSDIQTIVMNNIQMSHRTVVNLCLITQQLLSLTMNDVKILDKMINSQKNKSTNHPNFLVLLKQIAQYTNKFKWTHLKSLTLGINIFIFFPKIKIFFLSSRKKFN
jgi:S-adenosylmethionine:tRNA-ribosyltransferase-isomerase (queuine synthetase)